MSPSFADLGVAPRAASDLAARGITDPFPIQVATLVDALAGRDVAGKAPTGAGKTLAFGLPLVDRCGSGAPHRPAALVLVPTRELAGQVADELRQLARSHGLKVASVYGGVGFGPQRKALREGVDILVACPGRLVDLINQGDVRLDRIKVAVLDEADRMADMGFLPEVKRLLDQMPTDRQTLLFSATLDGDVDVIIRGYQRNPVRHELAGDDGKLPDATHLFWKTTRDDRVAHCAEVIRAAGSTIVFCRTRHGAERVAKKLGNQGVEAVAIHGARSQNQREKALRDFTAGRAQALVATDVAARGIHVDDVAAVVHLDPPADHKDYVHRSGRTARAGGRGTVVSLVADAERGAVTKIQKALGLPTGTTAPDLSIIPAAAPRAVVAPRHDRKPRAERADRAERPDRSRNDRPERPRNDRPRRDDARWETDPRAERPARAARPTDTPAADAEPANRAERREREFADAAKATYTDDDLHTDQPRVSARPQGSTQTLRSRQAAAEDTRTSTRPAGSPSTLRSRQAEQPPRTEPDGEARPAKQGANQHGMLRFYDQKKGFGFIIRPGAPDLFVHQTAIGSIDPRELTDGRTVAYVVEQGRKGEQATGVRLTSAPRVGRAERPSPRPGARAATRSGPRARR